MISVKNFRLNRNFVQLPNKNEIVLVIDLLLLKSYNIVGKYLFYLNKIYFFN